MWPRILMSFMVYVTPYLFVLHGVVDYYSDYLWSFTESDSSNVYDFIVGKLRGTSEAKLWSNLFFSLF